MILKIIWGKGFLVNTGRVHSRNHDTVYGSCRIRHGNVVNTRSFPVVARLAPDRVSVYICAAYRRQPVRARFPSKKVNDAVLAGI